MKPIWPRLIFVSIGVLLATGCGRKPNVKVNDDLPRPPVPTATRPVAPDAGAGWVVPRLYSACQANDPDVAWTLGSAKAKAAFADKDDFVRRFADLRTAVPNLWKSRAVNPTFVDGDVAYVRFTARDPDAP